MREPSSLNMQAAKGRRSYIEVYAGGLWSVDLVNQESGLRPHFFSRVKDYLTEDRVEGTGRVFQAREVTCFEEEPCHDHLDLGACLHACSHLGG